MDNLPDFSSSKLEIRNRIEGALRVKRRPSLYQYSLFIGFFLFTTICTALYLKNILLFRSKNIDGQIDYYSLEKLLLSDQLESDTIIEIPQNLSLISAGEATFTTTTLGYKGEL